MNKHLLTLLLLAGLALPTFVTAQDKESASEEATPKVSLRVGDPAPALTPGKWIKGEPVKSFEKGKVYVVEFWATWCPPCRTSIPHLTELQAKHKDVIIIGQNVSDNPEKVPAFVEKMGDKMNYRVAVDDMTNEKVGLMNKNWMDAAGQAGIPTAFLVGKDSKIVWIGHPSQLEDILDLYLAGKYDPVKQAELNVKQEKIGKELSEALRAEDFDKALKLADEMAGLSPRMAREAVGLKFQLLLEKKRYEDAYKLGPELFAQFKDQADPLNAIAWMLADDERLEKRDLGLAEKMALRANELTKGEVASVLDTLAKVSAAQGDYAKAVEWETKALAKADEDEKAGMKKTLEIYQAKLNKK
jgi:thiol-disulfide isomerase/thioredoxin